MSTLETNAGNIERISKKETDQYIDLPHFLLEFSYPVSLELSEWIGAKAYQKGFADPLEFLCLMANKFYTSINSSSGNILESFILNEGRTIENRTRSLILAVKKWETNGLSDDELAGAITTFCQNTYAVRLPMASFLLRMLLPERFGTVDFHCINALKSLGFKVKELPPENTDKNSYLEQYNGFDYLEYNQLITKIGKNYQVHSKSGDQRHMTPSEVDMALYEYDKSAGKPESPINIAKKSPSGKDKIQRIMNMVEEIVRGTRTGPPWVKKAGENFLQYMRECAENNDLDAMFKYWTHLAKGSKGKGVAGWLERNGLPTIESEYEKIQSIYYDN